MNTVTGSDLDAAATLLRKGSVVAIPTETVYGLAANAFNEDAVLEIFRVKNRPSFDPLIVHVRDQEAALSLVQEIPPGTESLMTAFWPGPLTLVLKKKPSIPDLVTSGLDTVGVRMPNHAVTLSLLRNIEFPLAAPSANPFGYISPTTAAHVADQLGGKIPYILDGGPSHVGVESTIIGYENGQWRIYRYGGITPEQISNVVGELAVPVAAGTRIAAPGMLESHYAPRKKFYLGEIKSLLEQHAPLGKAGLIFFSQPDVQLPPDGVIKVLSEKGSLDEAARNLFSTMRSLDASDVEMILAEQVPDTGIGKAINDRMRRAAAEHSL